jgi:CheY-like chemotaxis protein
MSNQVATTLVVEDDRANRAALVRLLQYSGLLVDWTDSVAGALEKLKARPKVVLLDLHLPDGMGTTILEHIRANDLPTKVCLITGSANEQTIEQIKTLGLDEVILKPFHAQRLLDWVRQAHAA